MLDTIERDEQEGIGQGAARAGPLVPSASSRRAAVMPGRAAALAEPPAAIGTAIPSLSSSSAAVRPGRAAALAEPPAAIGTATVATGRNALPAGSPLQESKALKFNDEYYADHYHGTRLPGRQGTVPERYLTTDHLDRRSKWSHFAIRLATAVLTLLNLTREDAAQARAIGKELVEQIDRAPVFVRTFLTHIRQSLPSWCNCMALIHPMITGSLILSESRKPLLCPSPVPRKNT